MNSLNPLFDYDFSEHVLHNRLNSDIILFEDSNIIVTAAIVPFCIGHYLIVSKASKEECDSIQAQIKYSIVNALSFIKKCIYKNTPCIAYKCEHMITEREGNYVDHITVHVLPYYDNTTKILEAELNANYCHSFTYDEYVHSSVSEGLFLVFRDNLVESYAVDRRKAISLQSMLPAEVMGKPDSKVLKTNCNEESIKVYDSSVLNFLIEYCCILPLGDTYKRLENLTFHRENNEAELLKEIIQLLLSLPFESCSDKEFDCLFDEKYQPGLFYIYERKSAPDFLMEEKEIGYYSWFTLKVIKDIEQIQKQEEYHDRVFSYGIRNLVSDVYWIFNYAEKGGKSLVEILMNQVYSDFFRRALMLLLTGSPFSICNNHRENNELLESIGVEILTNTTEYDLHERLKQSILSGLVGMNLKESLINTAPVSLEGTYEVTQQAGEAHVLIKLLDQKVRENKWIGIDDYALFEGMVINSTSKIISWITDDYLATLFELKFLEELLDYNSSLRIQLIPRYDSYSNDASYSDIQHMISLPLFKNLREYKINGRLIICRNGCDISSFDGTRMSKEMAEMLIRSDYVVISGARAYEMAQGMKKKAFYTGIAVCKGYTESVTGFDRDSGALIFLYQNSGESSFSGFRKRNIHRMQNEKYVIGLAERTAKDYIEKRVIK